MLKMSILLDTNVKKIKEKQIEKLVDKFQYILNNYESSGKKINKNDDMYKCIVNYIPQLLHSILDNKEEYDVLGSMGKGQKAGCPWIAILNKKCTSEIKEGIYICYLFKEDMSGFYLTLMQGVTKYDEEFKGKGKKYCEQVTNYFKNELKDNSHFSFDKIELSSAQTKNQRILKYEIATILWTFYKSNSINPEKVFKDLKEMVDVYEFIIKHLEGAQEYSDVVKKILCIDQKTEAVGAIKEIKNKLNTIGENNVNKWDETPLKEVEPNIDKSNKFKKITSSPIKKIDYITKAKKDAVNGLEGELLCLQYERKRLLDLGRSDLANKIKHVSIKSDAFGYDIESFEIDPKTNKEFNIVIEVKTTENKVDTDFYISKNEIEQAKKFQKKYCLFRIYDLYGNTPKFYRRFGEIEENFIVDPISYIARIKN